MLSLGSRLEAATSRLEDIALSSAAGSVSSQEVTAIPPPPPPPPPPVDLNETPRSVEAFDESVVEHTLKPFVELTKTFAGPLVIDQVWQSVFLRFTCAYTVLRCPFSRKNSPTSAPFFFLHPHAQNLTPRLLRRF